MTHPRRRGAVLAMVVLALVALGLLAHGALLLARQELAASRAGHRLLQARVAAETGYRAALSGASAGVLGGVPLGTSTILAEGDLGGNPLRGSALRLSREVWLVAGEGRAAGMVWGVGLGAPVWILDPVGRLEAAAAVVEVAGRGEITLAGEVRAFAVPEALPLPDDACGPWTAVLDSLRFILRSLPAVARAGPAPRGEPAMGSLGPEELARRLDPVGWGAGTPRPAVAEGVCDAADPLNLGDPAGGGSPCGQHLPARFREGDLLLAGGVGQGLLVATGNIILDGTRHDGVLLAGGTLMLRDGARLLGAARAGGGIVVDATSTVSGSPCRVLRALEAAAPVLGGAVPLAPPASLGRAQR